MPGVGFLEITNGYEDIVIDKIGAEILALRSSGTGLDKNYYIDNFFHNVSQEVSQDLTYVSVKI